MPIPTNVPATVWSNKGGEYGVSGPFLLADTSGLLLADTTGNNLTDSGIIVVPTPATIWTPNDGT